MPKCGQPLLRAMVGQCGNFVQGMGHLVGVERLAKVLPNVNSRNSVDKGGRVSPRLL